MAKCKWNTDEPGNCCRGNYPSVCANESFEKRGLDSTLKTTEERNVEAFAGPLFWPNTRTQESFERKWHLETRGAISPKSPLPCNREKSSITPLWRLQLLVMRNVSFRNADFTFNRARSFRCPFTSRTSLLLSRKRNFWEIAKLRITN